MDLFLQGLMNHLVFLCVMLPVIGAWLVLGVTGLGLDAIRRMALCNVVLSLMLSIVMVLNFQPQPRSGTPAAKHLPFQMVTSIRWTGSIERKRAETETESTGSNSPETVVRYGPGIRIETGVDGINLWFLPVINLIMLSVLVSTWNQQLRYPSPFYALLLLQQSALLGVFAAMDVILLVISLHAVLLLNLFLVGKWGAGVSSAMRTPFVTQQLGVWLITLSLAALTLTHLWLWRFPGKEIELTFSLPDLLREVPFLGSVSKEAGLYWRTVSPGICLGILLGAALFVPLYPIHHLTGLVSHPESMESPLLKRGPMAAVAVYLILRFVVPFGGVTFRTSTEDSLFRSIAQGMAGWILLSVAVLALLALNRRQVNPLLALVRSSQLGMAVLGVLALNGLAFSGSLLWSLQLILSLGVLHFLLEILSRHYGPFELEDLAGLAKRSPRFVFFWCVAVASLIGLPGLAGSSSGVVLLLGMSEWCWWSTSFVLLAQLLIAWGLVRTTQMFFQSPRTDEQDSGILTVHPLKLRRRDEPVAPVVFDLNRKESFALLPTVVILLWMGLAPHFFLNRMKLTVGLLATPWEIRQERAENHE